MTQENPYLVPFKKLSKKELEKLGEELLKEPDAKPEDGIITPANLRNPQDYIFLSGRAHKDYSYSNLLVCKHRLALGKEAQEAAQKLGLKNIYGKDGKPISFGNTGKDLYGREFIGNLNWNDLLRLNLMLGSVTLNPRQHADFRQLLQEGAEGKTQVKDGTGNLISRDEIMKIYDDLLKKSNPWRSEWLDADFKVENDKLFILYNHRLNSSDPKTEMAFTKDSLEECLMEQGIYVGLKFNKHGLPILNAKLSVSDYQQGKNMQYWCPDKDNNSVAGFGADSGGSNLYCYRNPDDQNASLGVFSCAEGAKITGEAGSQKI